MLEVGSRVEERLLVADSRAEELELVLAQVWVREQEPEGASERRLAAGQSLQAEATIPAVACIPPTPLAAIPSQEQ